MEFVLERTFNSASLESSFLNGLTSAKEISEMKVQMTVAWTAFHKDKMALQPKLLVTGFEFPFNFSKSHFV